MDRLIDEMINFYVRWTLFSIEYPLLINVVYLNYLVLFVNVTYVDCYFNKTLFIDRDRYIQIWKKNYFYVEFYSLTRVIVYNKVKR